MKTSWVKNNKQVDLLFTPLLVPAEEEDKGSSSEARLAWLPLHCKLGLVLKNMSFAKKQFWMHNRFLICAQIETTYKWKHKLKIVAEDTWRKIEQ